MNAAQAKKIQLTDILDRLGYKPLKSEQGGQELKYISPLRHEKTPSFNVSTVKNCYIDFGTGEGGNTLDFAVAYIRATGQGQNVSDALKWLRNFTGCTTTPDFFPKAPRTPLNPDFDERVLTFLKAHKVENPVITSYLTKERCINPALIPLYLQEVHYLNTKQNKTFYGFGMQNQSAGYEVRSASDQYKFQSALKKRDVTYIASTGHSKEVMIFEGMLDFLSLLSAHQINRAPLDVIVMHSLSSFNKTKALINENQYADIHLFLDNDDSGQKAIGRFIVEFDTQITDHRVLYRPHKDVNKAHVNGDLKPCPLLTFRQPPLLNHFNANLQSYLPS